MSPKKTRKRRNVSKQDHISKNLCVHTWILASASAPRAETPTRNVATQVPVSSFNRDDITAMVRADIAAMVRTELAAALASVTTPAAPNGSGDIEAVPVASHHAPRQLVPETSRAGHVVSFHSVLDTINQTERAATHHLFQIQHLQHLQAMSDAQRRMIEQLAYAASK